MKTILRRAQRGVVLFIALIVLVAMSLAGIALIRSVDTGVIVTGNLAFRQSAMHIGDSGIEAARSWLLLQTSATLYNPIPASAYVAEWAENVKLVGVASGPEVQFDWSAAPASGGPLPVAGTPAGYTVSYVIHRLCANTGDPASVTCVKQTGSVATTTTGTKGAAAFGQVAIQVPTSALYRVTVRVVGPRNTTSFVQAVIL